MKLCLAGLILVSLLTITSAGTNSGYSCAGISDVIVQLFGWKYVDIRAHCQELYDLGVCAIQVDPPMEHMFARGVFYNTTWYQRYRMVSYKIDKTDAGEEWPLDQMLATCGGIGLRVYADVVINHMTHAAGYTNLGSAGSWFDSTIPEYTMPGYSSAHFHQPGSGPDDCPNPTNNIEDPNDPVQVRNCRLQHLATDHFVHDLRTEMSEVQQNTEELLELLITKGFRGFRIAQARNIPPQDLADIVDGLTGTPFVYMDVGDFGDGAITNDEYTPIGRVEEVRAGEILTKMWRKTFPWSLSDIPTWHENLELEEDSVIFIDDQMTRRDGWERGTHLSVANWRTKSELETITALLLALPKIGYIKIHSGYSWPEWLTPEQKDINWEMSPPTSPPNITEDGCDPGGDHGFICEHLWAPIRSMIMFHNIGNYFNSNITNWWTNNNQQVAFSRNSGGFVAINNDVNQMMESLQTGMAAGTYCDLMTGPINGNTDCVGRDLTVDANGFTNIDIPAFDPKPMIAIRMIFQP